MNQLKISLDAVAANYKTLKNQFSGKDCGAVVKANGYGLGAAEIAERLQKEGCKKFFVATIEEGGKLRETVSEEIYIFHGVQKNEIKAAQNSKLIPVINNDEQLNLWPKSELCVIHFDTGMTRLGFEKLIDLSDRNVNLIMSHLASAEEEGNKKNNEQLTRFKRIAAAFPDIPKSLCNSYGIYLEPEYHFDLARPGIALYGGNPTPGEKNPLQNVVTLTAPIIQIHEINDSRTVGYGGDYQSFNGDVIATIPIGYADGILRTLGNRGYVMCDEYELPIVGRVSMDLITIKLNNLPKDRIRLGTMVEILGEKYTISDMARDAGTIEYEIITRLGQRFERIYA